VVKQAAPKLKDFGVELIDVRFMRINYNARVSAKIYERMISERQQMLALSLRGEGEAAKITGNKERDLKGIESEAIAKSRKSAARPTPGHGDLCPGYGGSPEAGEFYRFLRTMETYRRLQSRHTLILSTDSDFFATSSAASPPTPRDRRSEGRAAWAPISTAKAFPEA